MKKIILPLLIILSFTVFSQDNPCEVKVEALSGTYEGDCRRNEAHGTGRAVGIDSYEGEFKRGLPDGEGIYSWANGDVYEGEFKNGKPDGFGKLVSFNGEEKEGYWKFGYFTSDNKNAPLYNVNRKQYVNNYTIQRVGDGNKVSLTWQWGTRTLYTAAGLQMSASSGIESIMSNFCGYEQIEFPFNSHIEFDASDEAGSFYYHCIFDFDLLIPGEYEIKFRF